MFDLKDLTPEHFRPLIGNALSIEGTDHALVVEAVELIKSPSPRGQPFSLTLTAPGGLRGPQGIYRLLHPELGVLPVFLVPMEPKQGGFRLEAVFN